MRVRMLKKRHNIVKAVKQLYILVENKWFITVLWMLLPSINIQVFLQSCAVKSVMYTFNTAAYVGGELNGGILVIGTYRM
jgi:hypothetical protein